MNKLVKEIPSQRLSYEFLNSLNGIIGLTEREMQIFSALLDIHMSDAKAKQAIDCTINRRKVIRGKNISRDNLSRYIKRYKQLGLLVPDKLTGLLTINRAIVPVVVGGKAVQITLILKLKQDEQLQTI